MEVEELRQKYANNLIVKAICDHMAKRENNQTESKLRRMITLLERDGLDFKKSDVIGAFRCLEEVECGRYVEGRHGWPSRFIWDVKSLRVASVANGGAFEQETSLGDNDVDVLEDLELIEHSFVLRPELSISFELPPDLTEVEASRVAAFIKTLPFGEE